MWGVKWTRHGTGGWHDHNCVNVSQARDLRDASRRMVHFGNSQPRAQCTLAVSCSVPSCGRQAGGSLSCQRRGEGAWLR